MRKIVVLGIVLAVMLLFVSSVGAASVEAAPVSNGNSCWGQASAVFARTGEMGMHSSQQANPRFGLRNLARALYDAGAIPDDSMHSLGVFVSDALGLSIEACQ